MEETKKPYTEIKEKYEALEFDLPELVKLDEDFEISKQLDEETQFILRDIRKIIAQKFSAYLQLFELLKNPSSSPVFVYSILKNISDDDKKIIKEVYKELSKYQIQSMKLDTIYTEQLEFEYVKNGYDKWQELKTQILSILNKADLDAEEDKKPIKNGYFG